MFLPAFGMLMPGIQKRGDRHAINVVCLPFGVYFSGTSYIKVYMNGADRKFVIPFSAGLSLSSFAPVFLALADVALVA